MAVLTLAGAEQQLTATPSGVVDLRAIDAAIRSALDKQSQQSLPKLIEEAVAAQGLAIEPAPTGDVSGKFTMRLDDLFSVSETKPEHEVAEGVASIMGAQIHAAIRRAFQTTLRESVDSARQLLEHGRISEAADAASEALVLSGTSAAEISAMFKAIERSSLTPDVRSMVLKVIVAR